MDESNALRIWADLGRLYCARPRARANWAAVNRLISAAKDKLAVDAEILRELLAESRRRLFPLDDPFTVDLGAHRWLAGDREEAYSNWLEWIIKQIHSPRLICQFFDLNLSSDVDTWGSPTSVKREEVIDRGHPGHAGRLDLVVRFGKQAIIVIEVKKGSADNGDTGKHSGYCEWLSQQPELKKCPVLLATEDFVLLTRAAKEKSDCGFAFVSWNHVCVFLRRMASLYANNQNCVVAALLLAFAGAVEQNLLGMTARQVRRVVNGEQVMFNPKIVDHLKSATLELT